jgi:hypothetical protein
MHRILQDVAFSHPNQVLIKEYRAKGKDVFSYVFDQNNPWSPTTHGSHHACDLLYWFNAYDLPSDRDEKVSEAMKVALIKYVNGEGPWNKEDTMAFGPDGFVGVAAAEELKKRRRLEVYDILDRFPPQEVLKVSEYVRPAVGAARKTD